MFDLVILLVVFVSLTNYDSEPEGMHLTLHYSNLQVWL